MENNEAEQVENRENRDVCQEGNSGDVSTPVPMRELGGGGVSGPSCLPGIGGREEIGDGGVLSPCCSPGIGSEETGGGRGVSGLCCLQGIEDREEIGDRGVSSPCCPLEIDGEETEGGEGVSGPCGVPGIGDGEGIGDGGVSSHSCLPRTGDGEDMGEGGANVVRRELKGGMWGEELDAVPTEEVTDSDIPTTMSISDEQLPTNFRKTLLRRIRRKRGDVWLQKWIDLKEQGGLVHNICQASESNYWIRDSKNLRYREYRFALKVRLNLLPVPAQKRKYAGREADVRCRGCNGNVEMQEHCLNVCKGNMQAMRVRHNKVVYRTAGQSHPK